MDVPKIFFLHFSSFTQNITLNCFCSPKICPLISCATSTTSGLESNYAILVRIQQMALLPRFEAVGYLDYAASLFEMSMIFVLFSILSLNSSFSKFKKNSRFFFLKFTQKISCSYLNHVFLSFIFQSQYMRTFPKNRDHPRRHRGNHDKWIFKLVVNSHRIQSNLRPVSVWRGMHHKKK